MAEVRWGRDDVRATAPGWPVTEYARGRSLAAALTVVLVSVLIAAGAAAPPAAADPSFTLDGTYWAISDGRRAKTNDVYRPEVVVTAQWTVTSTCAATECWGRVESDQGWSADAHMINGRWRVEHEVPDWEPCPDGSTAPGRQIFSFEARTLTGFDLTIAPSGACDLNLPLTIEIPFALRPPR